MTEQTFYLCPGQGAQVVGMGKAWHDASAAARGVFEEADAVLGNELGAPLSKLCFSGPPDRLNRTDVAQPALFVAAIASYQGMVEREGAPELVGAAGLSLGEYTALHLAGSFDFETGLRLVALRGKLMQEAAQASESGMVALIGAEEDTAREVCTAAAGRDVLVCANFNAPGQVVLSGHKAACERAVAEAGRRGLAAKSLDVAGAFHSPLMQRAADRLAEALETIDLAPPEVPVWSNVTARPHQNDPELLRQRLVEQLVSPVRWSETCQGLGQLEQGATIAWHELAPGTVLRGLMRRIDRNRKVTSHDQP